MRFKGHNVVFKAQVGSFLRNLNDKDSDVDEKIFVMPTFFELYESKVFKDRVLGDPDQEIHDIRKLEKLWYNSNLAYLDVLYSYNIEVFIDEFYEILQMKDKIVTMNLPQLFSSCMGMYNGQFKELTKPTSDRTNKMVQEYGYNPKKAMMGYHFLNFLEKFMEQGFKDYRRANWYEGTEREFMMDIKRGEFTMEEILGILHRKESEVKHYEEVYKSKKFDEETNNKMQRLLRSMVAKHTIQLVNEDNYYIKTN
ncbi:hypothetical protein SP15_298 [Bacillus phage SP-15]|uniref:Nucleotidyltransferase n=1 Tax=Bacillus phage SP-15 TaxID=1792032 RepID=A0A127AWL3_9CAUD|nr:nucleotidyltransferase [Bacillus phage SP-15]AMM45106.1 hypothetical protein SP15_298 [Bacillus phage SP-15]